MNGQQKPLSDDDRAAIAIRAWMRERRIARNPATDLAGMYILEDLRDARVWLNELDDRTPEQERMRKNIERIFASFRS